MNDPDRAPKVSVLMPTWNRIAYLPHAVESVLNQSMENLELIIIDDGSTDESQKWIRQLAAREARVLHLSQEHQGISPALNLGLAKARGVWIARLDSDDEWDAEFLDQQLALSKTHPEARAIYSRAEAADDSLQPKGYFRGRPPTMPEDHLSSLLLGDFTCNITVIARRDDITKVGGWKDQFPHGEDWDLWLRIARLGPFQFNPAVLARYREHGNNITQQSWHEMPEMRVEILRSHLDDPTFPPEAHSWRGVALRRQHVNGAMAAFSTSQWQTGWDRLQRGFREGDGVVPTLLYAMVQFAAWVVVPRSTPVRALQRWLLQRRDRKRQPSNKLDA